MTLDSASEAQVMLEEKARRVELVRGRAYFDVAHDPARPFSVGADGRRVVAIGTRFDVRIDGDRFGVALYQGRVAVHQADPAKPAIQLAPGQQFTQDGGNPPDVTPVDPEAAPQWRDGMLSFENRPLSEVASELNRYSREKLIVRDPSVARIRINGVFRAGNAAQAARNIAAAYPVKLVKRENGDWELLPR